MTPPTPTTQATQDSWSFHAHIYYDVATTRGTAERLRERIAELFPVSSDCWHDALLGRTRRSMYQVAFEVPVFAQIVPWLALNRQGLDVLVHPNTLQPRADHMVHSLGSAGRLALKPEVLAERIEAHEESAVEANRRPDLGLGARGGRQRLQDGWRRRSAPRRTRRRWARRA